MLRFSIDIHGRSSAPHQVWLTLHYVKLMPENYGSQNAHNNKSRREPANVARPSHHPLIGMLFIIMTFASAVASSKSTEYADDHWPVPFLWLILLAVFLALAFWFAAHAPIF